MIKPIYVLWIPILSSAFIWIRIKLEASCSLRLLSQATSVPFLPLFRAQTEQHQVNSLRISLLKTWILNLIPHGDPTTITHEIFVHFVPDFIINKAVFILLPLPECSLYVGQSYFEYNDRDILSAT
ncbi:hypothetical protein CHARACLAT_030230 [Characodon lateralis]|uniref:Follicle-stimulating hormone receptor n=1 Tax=Characodon lateralis TaxID=208331 RepID=A0ABU7EEA7_9TELE|nr:hypothetical protein [Characodon lateralis]